MNTEKIVIERKKRFTESKYSVGIYIDNEFIVNTLKDNRQELELSPGKYLLKVEQGNRSGELEIEVLKGKTTVYQFSGNSFTYVSYFLLVLPWILINLFEAPSEGALIFYIPGIIATAYTFTSGRKKYFVITKTEEENSWMDNQ